MIVVDTSVWIDFFQGVDSPQRRMLHDLIENQEDLCLTGIIVTEILQGIRDERESAEVRQYLLDFPIFHPRDISTYVEAADIFKRCARKGRTVRKTVDCLIAAVAMENGLMVLHKDKDFDSIAACTDLRMVKVS
jgi:predicted nucleic acid-binding protein